MKEYSLLVAKLLQRRTLQAPDSNVLNFMKLYGKCMHSNL